MGSTGIWHILLTVIFMLSDLPTGFVNWSSLVLKKQNTKQIISTKVSYEEQGANKQNFRLFSAFLSHFVTRKARCSMHRPPSKT